MDPYTTILAGLWSLFEADTTFCALVPVGNRIKLFGDRRAPDKDETISADYPEVKIYPVSASPMARNCSSSFLPVVNMGVRASSGEQCVDTVHYPLTWCITRLLFYRADRVLKAVTWAGHEFIEATIARQVSDGIRPEDEARGVKQWSAIWDIEFRLVLPKRLLK